MVMFINLCVINVGASVGNRAIVCDVFSFVDILFIVDPPVDGLGNYVDGDIGNFVMITGTEKCDVCIYVRRSLQGLVDVSWIDAHGVILNVVADGIVRRIAGVYLRPHLRVDELTSILAPYLDCSVIVGDMNARHDRWGYVADVGGHNQQGQTLARLLADMDFMVPTVPTHQGMSVIDLCAFRWKLRKYRISQRAGLPHAAQILKFVVDTDRLPKPKPQYTKANWDCIKGDLGDIDPGCDDIWMKARAVVDGIPRKWVGRDHCMWWNDDLERMRDDLRSLRRDSVRSPGRRQDYLLVRKVYRAALAQARYDHMRHVLSTAKDPDIFRYVHAFETSRTLPAMHGDDGTVCTSHGDISELIAEQLNPVPPAPWVSSNSALWPHISDNIGEAMRMSPSNTATSWDDMSYPFARFWYRHHPTSFVRCIEDGVKRGNPDWHRGEVVLIRKANKPRYDVVKGWRMIHLLPVMTKIMERMVLLGIAKHVELEETQFGSRRKRGVHDAMAVVYEFLESNRDMFTAVLSMDVEGGFDRIDLDLMADFLVARGCPAVYAEWVRGWAAQRTIKFRFNGHVSTEFHLSKGIPQGSPLSPFLFGVYVADIFRPRLKYSPSLRSVTVSFVDDGVVVVAGDTKEMVVGRMEEVFEDCVEVARGRGMCFSGLKTEWIGFGRDDWGVCKIGGCVVAPVDDLRVLGYRFGRNDGMDKHVEYWLKRGLETRGRISAIARRFGGQGGLGSWEVMRLVQGALLPVMEYGLEFVASDARAMHRIDVVVRDSLRSLFRMPLKLANNILYSELGIPPTHIRATYYRSRMAQRFLNYAYGECFPWYGSIRNGWCLDGMKAIQITSTERLTTDPRCFVAPDKAIGELEGRQIIKSLESTQTVVAFVDGSNKGTGCGCAWVAYKGHTEIRIGSARLPDDWNINSCELFAILSLLRDLVALRHPSLAVFSDSQFAVKAIRDMQPVGESSGIWHAFAPLISRFNEVTIRWIPGHVGILGNEITDRLAKRACDIRLEPGRIAGVDFGFGAYARFRELRLATWRTWHAEEGHTYYRGIPRDFRHLRLLSRLDLYALIRARSGTGMTGHDDCVGRLDRLHWTSCDRYKELRPPSDKLWDNRVIHDWVKWIRHHDWLGLGIPSNVQHSMNVTVAFGNPFDGTACIIRDGHRIIVDVAKAVYRCDACGLVHSSSLCPLPDFKMLHKAYFMAPGHVCCPVCLAPNICSPGQVQKHMYKNPACRDEGQRRFWHGVKLLWQRFSEAERVKLAVKWLFPVHTTSPVQCTGCTSRFGGSKAWLRDHLRVEKNARCWPSLWVKFLTECDATGVDERDKLLIYKILGWDHGDMD